LGVFFFVQELDSSHPNAVIVEIKFPGIIDGVADLDTLSDVGGRDFIKVALEADCGVVVDDPLVSDEEYLIQFAFGQAADGHPHDGGVVAVYGALAHAAVELMMIILLKPPSEGVVEFIQGDSFRYPGQKAITYRAEKSFMLSST